MFDFEGFDKEKGSPTLLNFSVEPPFNDLLVQEPAIGVICAV